MGQVITRIKNGMNPDWIENRFFNTENSYREDLFSNRIKLSGKDYVQFFLNNPSSLPLFSQRLSEIIDSSLNEEDSGEDLRSLCLLHGLTLLLVNRSIPFEPENLENLIDEVLEGSEI